MIAWEHILKVGFAIVHGIAIEMVGYESVWGVVNHAVHIEFFAPGRGLEVGDSVMTPSVANGTPFVAYQQLVVLGVDDG